MNIFIERPVATSMVFLAILALGIFSFTHTPLELAPKEDFPRVDIETSWPGVSPEVIQIQVTAPLEEAAAAVKGVRKVSSESQAGVSRLTLELDPRLNFEFVNLALRESIARIRQSLPYGVQPEVKPYVPEDMRVRPFLSYTISGQYELQTLREMVREKLEFGLGSVKGVARVEVSGGSDPEIRLELDENKTKSLNIHPYQVISALRESLTAFPAGRIKKGNSEYIFKVAGSPRNEKDLENIHVAWSGEASIRLKDVARLSLSYGEIFAVNRINGKPTVMLTVLKEKGRSTLKVAGDVKARLEAVKKELPPDLIFRAVDDEGLEIQKNLNQLCILAGIIVLLVFLAIYAVLRRLRPAFLILSSIIFSVVMTFNLIYIFKISLNMLTLGALALGFGMFVDNSIVVFENTLREREKGLSPKEAAVRGARGVFLPVLASTLTTIGVFFCFPFFQGRLKIYYLPLAVVMSSALAASLLVSFSLIPALSPGLLKIKERKAKEKKNPLYETLLKHALHHPLETILVVSFIFYGSYKWFRADVTIGEFFRWHSKERLAVYIGLPPGSSLKETDAVARKFEEQVLDFPFDHEMNAWISPGQASLVISFPPEVENSSKPYLLKEELIQLATQFAGVSISIFGFDPQGYYSGLEAGTYYDSRIKFYGYNLRKLRDITSNLEKALRQNPRIQEVRIVSSRFGRWRLDSHEYVLKIDQAKIKAYRIDPDYLYFNLTALLGARFSSPIRAVISGKEKSISVKFPEADKMDLKTLQDSLIRTSGGESLRLKDIATLEEKQVAGSIDREDQRFQQTVMWEFRGPYKAADRYKKTVFDSLSLPPGFSATLEEQWLLTGEEKNQLRFALVFSLIIIYLILAGLYESLIQPLFVLLSIPLALIGVFVAFVLADYPFDSSAFIGVILLAGIVVNNAILLVDHINRKKAQGLPLLEAVIQGSRERIRPIIMTTGTTVLAMLPLLLIQLEGGRRQIWSSLALATVGGLTSSALFLVLVIPIFYFWGQRIGPWIKSQVP